MNIIEAENLSYRYPASDKAILDGLTLTIEKGDFLAIVGNNGCGKSTFCKTLNGLIPHFITGEFKGSVKINGHDTKAMTVSELAHMVGYVYQDFDNQIVRPTVLDDASYACLNYAYSDYLSRGKEALKLCGLQNKEKDYVFELSGGQTHLLALAGALALNPEVLILDEPIAQLDPGHADLIYGILKELNEVHGKTIIVIEHHSEYIAEYCHHVMLLKDGKCAFKLPTKEALNHVEELKEANIFVPQVTRAAYALKSRGYNWGRQLPISRDEGLEYFKGMDFWPNEKPTSFKRGEVIVDFDHVVLGYRTMSKKRHVVFKDLNLKIYEGDRLAIIGSNGAGKTSLLKMLVGLSKPLSGSLKIMGKDTSAYKPQDFAEYVSLVMQNPEQMFIADSIASDIAFAMKARNIVDYEEKTAELLEAFELTALQNRDGRLLSGGQMRRASLAIGVALNPEILLLDEPTANLDMATRKEIMDTLSRMQDIIKTAVIATHDMQLVAEWANRIVVLHDGEVIADGDRDSIFADQRVIEEIGIRPPAVFDLAKELKADNRIYTVEEFVKQARVL